MLIRRKEAMALCIVGYMNGLSIFTIGMHIMDQTA